MDPQNYKTWCPIYFENERKNIIQSANFFDIISYCKKRRCSHEGLTKSNFFSYSPNPLETL